MRNGGSSCCHCPIRRHGPCFGAMSDRAHHLGGCLLAHAPDLRSMKSGSLYEPAFVFCAPGRWGTPVRLHHGNMFPMVFNTNQHQIMGNHGRSHSSRKGGRVQRCQMPLHSMHLSKEATKCGVLMLRPTASCPTDCRHKKTASAARRPSFQP